MIGDSERELRWNLTQAQEDLLVQFERAQQLQKRVEVLEETLEQISVIASNQGKENPSAAISYTIGLNAEKVIKPLHTLTKTQFVYIVLLTQQTGYPQVIPIK